MKKIILLMFFIFTGCSLHMGGFNEFKAKILKCEFIQDRDQDRFMYTFKDLNSDQEFSAVSNEHYYDVGDIVKVSIQNSNVLSMKLIEQAKENIQTNDNIKIDKKRKNSKKNKEIPVPKAESLSF